MEHFTAPQIKRMVHNLTQDSASIPLFPAQAGLARVGSPECMAGPARHVLWWSFNQEAAQPVFMDPFSRQKKESLAQAGVELPDPGMQAERNALRWQRPFMLAESTLILICAQSSPAGEEQYPHPLWDELAGKIEDKEQAASLQNLEITSRDKPARHKKDPATLPRPEPLWRLEQPGLCARRSQESPNSLSSLLSCPLQWVLSYQGRLSSGLTASLSEPEELEGWFVHEIVARVLQQCQDNPGNVGNAVKAADEIFDEQGPYLAARFFLPGFDHLRAKVRNTTREAVSQIPQIVQQGGFGIQYVEEPLKRQLTDPNFTLEGKPDLVLSSPLAVLDMKRGGLSFRRGEIETGSSVQLAVYSRLLVQNDEQPLPPAGYFMLWSGQLITAYPRVFPGAMHIEGPPLEETWNAITQGYISNWEELEQGEIRAPGNEQEPLSESGIVEGRLHLKPCAFCGLDTLCGKAFAEE
ncbi:MAG: PD-(D/E)XK nuclease family protein [Desulfovermiculus sp.]